MPSSSTSSSYKREFLAPCASEGFGSVTLQARKGASYSLLLSACPSINVSLSQLIVPYKMRNYSLHSRELTLPAHNIQESNYILGQKFSACYVLKFALQRGEGRKGRECQFQNKAHRTFDPPNKYLESCISEIEFFAHLSLATLSAPSLGSRGSRLATACRLTSFSLASRSFNESRLQHAKNKFYDWL